MNLVSKTFFHLQRKEKKMDPNVKLYFCPTNLNNSLLINDNNDNCSSGFYKCIGFERGFLQQCKFSSNLQSDFHSHLQHEHEFTKYFCRYCFLKDSSNVCSICFFRFHSPLY